MAHQDSSRIAMKQVVGVCEAAETVIDRIIKKEEDKQRLQNQTVEKTRQPKARAQLPSGVQSEKIVQKDPPRKAVKQAVGVLGGFETMLGRIIKKETEREKFIKERQELQEALQYVHLLSNDLSIRNNNSWSAKYELARQMAEVKSQKLSSGVMKQVGWRFLDPCTDSYANVIHHLLEIKKKQKKGMGSTRVDTDSIFQELRKVEILFKQCNSIVSYDKDKERLRDLVLIKRFVEVYIDTITPNSDDDAKDKSEPVRRKKSLMKRLWQGINDL